MIAKITIQAPDDFSLPATVYSHGWCVLHPFSIKQEPFSLLYSAIIRGNPVDFEITENTDRTVSVLIRSIHRLSLQQRGESIGTVRTMLRMDESFDPFYSMMSKEPHFRWIKNARAGRMLRCRSFFEDMIKVVCTTNCSWALTTTIVSNLCSMLGEKTAAGNTVFPSPEIIAAQTESFMRKEIRAGYRAPYILELSDIVASGKTDVEQFRNSVRSTDELYREFLSLKGVGPYAAESLLKLIGRYDHLALDSWVRKKYYELHHNGRHVGDKTIVKRYRKYKEWAGLVFWLEMTRQWYDEKFPF
jgi:3-methyladenine DNA glycosylase/8-oxoguanine DNA glycosylase